MTSTALERFHRRLNDIDNTRKRLESLYANGHLQLRDLLSGYESLFMRSVVAFERFCEGLFFDILNGRTRYRPTDVTSRIKQCSSTVFRDVVLQNKRYVDWLPYDFAEKRAKIYLTKGRPFTNLVRADKETLEGILVIRHVIAHSSPHAIKQFRKLIDGMALLPREKSPASFLRSQLSTAPPQTRFEAYIVELGQIASKIFGTPVKRRRTK